MNPEIKAKWVEALRSGKYSQTQHVLRNENGMCCLGVLADIVDPEGWARDGEDWEHHKCIDLPAADFCEQVGLPVPHNPYDYLDEKMPVVITTRLAGMNDSGQTFAEIADVIEKEL
jgi:hypothetical protein